WTEVKAAEEDEAARPGLLSASAGYNVGGLPCCLPLMRQVLAAGLLTVGLPAVEFLQRRFAEASDAVERAGVAPCCWGSSGRRRPGSSPSWRPWWRSRTLPAASASSASLLPTPSARSGRRPTRTRRGL